MALYAFCRPVKFVGWVERMRNPSTNLERCVMGFVSLNPSYGLRADRLWEIGDIVDVLEAWENATWKTKTVSQSL